MEPVLQFVHHVEEKASATHVSYVMVPAVLFMGQHVLCVAAKDTPNVSIAETRANVNVCYATVVDGITRQLSGLTRRRDANFRKKPKGYGSNKQSKGKRPVSRVIRDMYAQFAGVRV